MKALLAYYKRYGALLIGVILFALGMGFALAHSIAQWYYNGDYIFFIIVIVGVLLEVVIFKYSLLPLFNSYQRVIAATERK